MRHFSGKFWILSCALCVINAIGLVWIHHDLTKSARPVVRIISALPQPSADEAERLTFVFDRSMVEAEAVGREEIEPIFEIEPAWPGKWVWTGTFRCEFQLDEPLPPGRVFRVRASDNLTVRTDKRLEGQLEFSFATEPLKLKICRLVSADEREVTVELTFNQPVDPGDLLRSLRVRGDDPDGWLGGVRCLTKRPEERLTIQASRPRSGYVRIVLDDQLTGHEAELPLGKEVTEKLQLPKGFCLLSSYVRTPGIEDDISIRLRFSHQIGGEQELPELAVEPKVEELKVHRSRGTLVLTGGFRAGRSYTVKVPGTLLNIESRTLGEDQTVTVEIPDRRPAIVIPHSAGILSPGDNMLLDAEAVNVEGLKISAFRLHENNLFGYLHGLSPGATGRSVLSETVKLDLPHNSPSQVALDLSRLLGTDKGIYSIRAAATNRSWTSASAVVAVTDLAITAKQEREGLLAWVVSLRTGKPVDGAEVAAVSYNNQTLASGVTDSEGIVKLMLRRNHPDGEAWVVMARKDDDLSYLRLNENRWVIDGVDQSGRPYAENYEVMLYTERGVYRPGDVIRLTGVIRDRVGDIPTAFPLAVQVARPDGREVAELIAQPGQQGLFHVEFASSSNGQTGPYRFGVTIPGEKRQLGSTHAMVEAFIPVRMEVRAETSAKRYGSGDKPVVEVTGRYLWDEPAAELPVKVTASVRPIAFHSRRHPKFDFGWPESWRTVLLKEVGGKLNAAGRARLELALSESLAAGLYRMSCAAAVTDPGGRSVSSNATAELDTVGGHVGLHLESGRVANVGVEQEVQWVCVDAEDNPRVPDGLRMSLERIEYDTVVKVVNGRRVWQSTQRMIDVKTEDVTADGASGSFTIECPVVGRYRLTVSEPDGAVSTRVNVYAWDYGGLESVEMNQPERLKIVTDKDEYAAGEMMKVQVMSPMAGTMLLTVETDHVVATHVREIPENSVEVSVPLPEGLRGGAFITATVVRAVDGEAESWLPHRAMGMARIGIDHAGQRLPVVISAPRRAEPSETVSVKVQTGRPIDPERPGAVHIWAVDEGILLASAYETPDPEEFFLSPRRPGVFTADAFFRLLPDYARPKGMARIGAGRDKNKVDALRRSPVPTKLREAAVVWREVMPVGPDGSVEVEMKMPELIGEMRLMAAAFDHDSYGSADQALTLTSKLIVEASWPRFAAEGDVFEVPVKLFNSTDKTMTVRVAVAAEGPVEISDNEDTENIVVDPVRPASRLLKVRVTGMGPVEVSVMAEQIGESEGGEPAKTHCKTSWAARPASALHSVVSLESIKAGTPLEITVPDVLIGDTVRTKIDLSASPTIQLGPVISKLIDYPYGCVEQTTSQLFALLYAAEVTGDGRRSAIREMVQAGISRLWSMQTRSGGLSYWPGGTEANMWGTAYATHCLLEARTARYDVDEQFIEELTKYLDRELRDGTDDGPDRNTRALICRVLASFGQPPHGWMARLAEEKDELDLAGRAHLAGAFHLAGRMDRAMELLPAETPKMQVAKTTSGRLTSQVHQEAVLLSVLLDIDLESVLVAALAGRLEKARLNGQWGSTLSNASALAALGRYQVLVEQEEPAFTGNIKTVSGTVIPFDHAGAVSGEFFAKEGPLVISSEGVGRLYVAVSHEGLAKPETVKPYDRNLTVERYWLNRDGKLVDPERLRVGDLVRVAIVVQGQRRVDNIAVVDALPGGMEVENPRLVTSAKVPPLSAFLPRAATARTLAKQKGKPTYISFGRADHIEFLDDRVVLFCSARPQRRVFQYALRVTTSGEFVVPPIQGSCMYDPGVASLGAIGRVKISR